MAMLVVLYSLILLSSGAHAIQIVSQPTTRFPVEQGHKIILPFNYTLDPAERDKGLTMYLEMSSTKIVSYFEIRGTVIDNRTIGPLLNRAGVELQSSPLKYIGLLIEQTTINDTGSYTWSITIDGAKTPDLPIELIVGNKPGQASLQSTHEGEMVYTLTCTVTGGIPSPNITILNGTEVMHTSSASTTTINVTVEFPSVFHCVGSNALGSRDSDSIQLPIPTTTMSPTTSTVTTTGDNTAFTTTKPPDNNQTRDNTGQTPTTAKAPGTPGNPNTALIVGVICGCVGGIVIIVILVCVYKKKKPKTKPGKKELTLEHRVVEGNDNTYALDENSTKLATEQEQEKKQQKDVKGRQHNQGPRGTTKPAGGDGRKKRVANADPNAEETEQEQEAKQQRSAKSPRGKTKPAGGDGRKKQVSNADPNAEDTEEEQEAKQQLNVEGLQYADLDLRPTGKTKPAGGDGRNKLVFNDDSHVEYAEVRKV